MSIGGKYLVGEMCDWCSASPAKEFVIQVNGVKSKRYKVTAMACRECAQRMDLGDD